MAFVIRPARSDDVATLAAVERDGDRRFSDTDGVPVGFADTVAPAELEAGVGDGRLWVAVSVPGRPGDDEGAEDGGGEVVGFALAAVVDGRGHLDQVSVRLAHQGQGIGRRLVEAVLEWAAAAGFSSVTLCTFGEVGWNRPLYEHLGFAVVPAWRWTPQLRARFQRDGALGLDLDRRVVVERPVGAPTRR